jgi:hypothetical protein
MYTLGNQTPCVLQMNFSLDREKELPHVEQSITVAELQDLLNRVVEEWKSGRDDPITICRVSIRTCKS